MGCQPSKAFLQYLNIPLTPPSTKVMKTCTLSLHINASSSFTSLEGQIQDLRIPPRRGHPQSPMPAWRMKQRVGGIGMVQFDLFKS